MNLPSSPYSPFKNYCAYLVRFWQDSPQAAWRASAQEVQTGKTMRFANLDSLFAFLEAQTGVQPANAVEPSIVLE